jgi:competence protein ComEA
MRRKYKMIFMLTGYLFITACGKREDMTLSTEEVVLDTEDVNLEIQDKKDQDHKFESEDTISLIYIHVCGAVVEPGVYTLMNGSRIYEAIQMAGGFTEEAARNYVNQALPLIDGQQVKVPTIDEAGTLLPMQVEGEDTPGAEAPEEVVDLNRATVSQLMTLTGIGQAKAEAIIAYREEHGVFRTIEDIKNIEGIKEGVFNKIKDKITVYQGD